MCVCELHLPRSLDQEAPVEVDPHHLEACVCLVAQSCLTLRNVLDCSSPGSSVHGALQARILEWVANPFSKGSS